MKYLTLVDEEPETRRIVQTYLVQVPVVLPYQVPGTSRHGNFLWQCGIEEPVVQVTGTSAVAVPSVRRPNIAKNQCA